MRNFLTANAWWLLQILGLSVILVSNILARKMGICWFVYMWNVSLTILVTGWAFMASYALAPSFFQAWFVATAIIALYGLFGSVVILGESLSLMKVAGASLALAGAFLLVKG